MRINTTTNQSVKIREKIIETRNSFCYLGSVITNKPLEKNMMTSPEHRLIGTLREVEVEVHTHGDEKLLPKLECNYNVGYE